ncbi:hypothetical protein B1219_22890 [Pseudomonas ogarae]|nr:hypothetical protein B1219_22890 [Pseudomonas ogarae]OPG77822.1 hypothetical protein B1218_18810 [Pseudomonas ogarae]
MVLRRNDPPQKPIFFLPSNDKNPRFANLPPPTQSPRHLISIAANAEQQKIRTRGGAMPA